MKLLNDIKQTDVSFKEFSWKFPLVFVVSIPLPMISLALTGYYASTTLGFPKGVIPTLFIISGVTLGTVIGFFLSMIIIRIGHK